MKKYLIPAIIAIVVFFSCDDDSSVEDPATLIAKQFTIDSTLIKQYLDKHNLNADSTESGLYYIIEEQGAGAAPDLNSIVTVNYKGKLLDGTIFDEGTVSGHPLTAYILGWQEGIQLFNVGGKGTLIIPSKLGYGDKAVGDIPKNSVLIFDIELVEIE